MLKLTIYSNGNTTGYHVRFKKKTTINMEVYNPMFNDVGLFSWMITVYKDENQHVFNHLAALDNVKTSALTFKLEVGTDVLAEGTVKVTDYDDDSIEFYLKSGYSSVSYFLNKNYMCKTNIWGDDSEDTNIPTVSSETLDGCYPEYPLVYPPIVVDDEVVNYCSFQGTTLHIGNLHAAIYVRWLIKKLISALGYSKISDAFEDIDDFNRLALFAATKNNENEANSEIRLSLPYIYIADFLTDLRDRFNIAIYFSPYLYQAEVLNIADTLKLDPVDWTDKFQGINSAEPAEEKEIDFTQSADDDEDLYTADELEEDYTPKSYADMDALDDISFNDGSTVYIESLDRYLQYEEVDEDNSLTINNNNDIDHNTFRSATESYNDDDYYTMQDKYKEGTAIQVTNTVTTANTLNFIAQFIWPEWSGSVKSSIYISAWFKRNGGYLVTKVYTITYDDPDDVSDSAVETLVGYDKRLLDNIDYSQQSFHVQLCVDEFDIDENTRLVVRFYCYSTNTDRTITISFGGYENLDGYNTLHASYADIDYPYVTYKEIGALSDVEIGDNEDSLTEFKPSSKIPLNVLHPSGGYLFEMPESSLSITRAVKQTDFEYLIYRGKRYDIQQGIVAAGYCNYDVLDIFKEEYTSKLVTQVEPTLSLAWKGENGLLEKMWKNRLTWERYFKQPVELDMDLNINDIINHKIYRPFMVDSIRYVINKLSFDIDENADISNVVASAFTL